jgi:uncharacterized protein
MNCPIDGTTLLIAERHEVEIDYCRNCRGVWLDRGELDKMLRRADDDERSGGTLPAKKKKKKGWLSDMFEFGE